ncbi:hypothetical protein EUA93_10075 [Nocardioides oleivorans]|uniref:Uncharacterized protein n=1 Tax=Nocardioides oleivorans TaxID=273676 RepID=A0A4Q2RZS5_9ACTN|nr:hypothetical protein [Nocardioides oleivorans]RYB94658.1 hypothetical protein EUA93_10075 [Nocardioides oleivorans]
MKYDIANLTDARPTRRSVTRAAAWSVPVIATATTVPAFAASCAPVTVTAANATAPNRSSAVDYSVTFNAGTGAQPTNVMTVKATYDTGMVVRNDANGGTNDNFTIQNPVGGLNTYGLVMAQRLSSRASNTGAFGHYTFTFTKPVTGLTFTLTDIDSTTGDFWDSVWLTPGFSKPTLSAGLTGAGTSADPIRQSNGNTAVDNASGANGNATITYPGTISSFTINYSNRQTGTISADPDQVVTIANFSFGFQPC